MGIGRNEGVEMGIREGIGGTEVGTDKGEVGSGAGRRGGCWNKWNKRMASVSAGEWETWWSVAMRRRTSGDMRCHSGKVRVEYGSGSWRVLVASVVRIRRVAWGVGLVCVFVFFLFAASTVVAKRMNRKQENRFILLLKFLNRVLK